MDYRNLIKRFYLGGTSLEEEELLRNYLSGDGLPADIAEEKELLLAMLEPAEYDCTADMAGVSAMIDSLAREEETMHVQRKHTFRRAMLRYIVTTAAAAAVLLLLLRLVPAAEEVPTAKEPPLAVSDPADTFGDPKDAARHMNLLFSLFSEVAGAGLEDQKEHLRTFAVLGDIFYKE